MHSAALSWIASALGTVPATSIVELGSRIINGSPRSVCPASVPYVGVDCLDGPGVDVVCQAETYTPETPVDLVICAEVLEHAAAAPAIVANALAMLAEGGHLIITAASPARAPHSAIDGSPFIRDGEWYSGVALEDLTRWIETAGGIVLTSADVPSLGDVYVTAQKGLTCASS